MISTPTSYQGQKWTPKRGVSKSITLLIGVTEHTFVQGPSCSVGLQTKSRGVNKFDAKCSHQRSEEGASPFLRNLESIGRSDTALPLGVLLQESNQPW